MGRDWRQEDFCCSGVSGSIQICINKPTVYFEWLMHNQDMVKISLAKILFLRYDTPRKLNKIR